MKYQIFEMTYESNFEPDGYNIKTIMRYTLIGEDYPNTFSTLQEAEQYLREHVQEYVGCMLTILPVITIDFNGKIEDE